MEISVGSILEGTVKSITKFGAFISFPGGRSGLVHISEIAHSYVNDVKDHLQEGQQVRVKVVGIDEAGRINLSIKKAMDPPPRPQNSNPRFGGTQRSGGASYNGNSSRPASAPSGGSARSGGYRSGGASVARSASPKEQPTDFEYRLKQFMQTSDSKLSEMRMTEKRSSRRSGHK